MASKASLLIGIGNPLRGDDGVGGFLVEELARLWRSPADPIGGEPRARLKSVQQLTPELAVLVAEANRVLFVDAWVGPGTTQPWIEMLLPAPSREATPPLGPGSHGWEPITLLRMAEVLYGWQGEGALLRVPAHAFPHGAGFSAPLKRCLPGARQLLRRWLRREEPETVLATGGPGAKKAIG